MQVSAAGQDNNEGIKPAFVRRAKLRPHWTFDAPDFVVLAAKSFGFARTNNETCTGKNTELRRKLLESLIRKRNLQRSCESGRWHKVRFTMSIFVTKLDTPQRNYCVVPVNCRLVACAFAIASLLYNSLPASASCGNYLFRNGRPVAQHDNSLIDERFTESQETAALRVQPGTPIRQCSGPNCSGRPHPIQGATSNLNRGLDQQAVVESCMQAPSIRDPLRIPESERGNIFVPSLIFRPPDA